MHMQWDSYAYIDAAKEANRLAELEKAKQVDKAAEAERRRKNRARDGCALPGYR